MPKMYEELYLGSPNYEGAATMRSETINGRPYTWAQAAQVYRSRTGANHVAHGYGTPWDAIRGLLVLGRL